MNKPNEMQADQLPDHLKVLQPTAADRVFIPEGNLMECLGIGKCVAAIGCTVAWCNRCGWIED
ncbi:hypothetical protein CJD36_020000 [Flavipsychrobacter stenotrophus]|uniref:Uncharacterized protein n=1 Tax=Flavipsychrobacter stenotrophus TaxID=2077091 RepID=A0A2S7SRI4_9BACT|nr:hypothetical protein [Flavipsychrobacter stenotrophus]PQJ09523.1 hypothetical protein CJD36_020000 [Flavipsychrobacter stenotrophus]